MSLTYKIFRAIVMALLTIVVVVPVALYILLSTSDVQTKIRDVAQQELSQLLGTEVSIGKVEIQPFNRIDLYDVAISDDYGKDALNVSKLASRFELAHFLKTGRIVVDYLHISGLKAQLYKKTDEAPLNIAKIIERLKGDQKDKREKRFSLAISTVEIENASLTFDVLSAPRRRSFDPKHLNISNLELLTSLPKISDKGTAVLLEHLSFSEHSGLDVKDLKVNIDYSPKSIAIEGLTLELPHSQIALGDIFLENIDLSQLSHVGKDISAHLSILPGSFITPSDLKCFTGKLASFGSPCSILASVSGTLSDFAIDSLAVYSAGAIPFKLELQGRITGLPDANNLHVSNTSVNIATTGTSVAGIVAGLDRNVGSDVSRILREIGGVRAQINLDGSLSDATYIADIETGAGNINAEGSITSPTKGNFDITTDFAATDIDIRRLTSKEPVGIANLQGVAALGISHGLKSFDTSLNIDNVEINGAVLENIEAQFSKTSDNRFEGTVNMQNGYGLVDIRTAGSLEHSLLSLDLDGKIRDLDAHGLKLLNGYEGYRASLDMDVKADGDIKDWVSGHASLKNLVFSSPESDKKLKFNNFTLEAGYDESPRYITIESDLLKGRINGDICLQTLAAQCRNIVSGVLPAFITPVSTPSEPANRFRFEFEISNAESVSNFFNVPVQVVYPATIDGAMDYAARTGSLTLDAPYLQQGDKIIENTALLFNIDGNDSRADLYVTTTTPTQKGPMSVASLFSAADNRIDTKIDWHMDREKPINGDLSFSTLLGRDENNALTAEVNFNPGDINFGNAVWKISPSLVSWASNTLTVKGFKLAAADQTISVNGSASDNPDSELTVGLDNVELISIFETLDINNALIGGRASGIIHASGLLGKEPQIICNSLKVKNIGYNYCTIGDADVRAHWDNDKAAFALDADIVDAERRKSHIFGDIFAKAQSLDIVFDTEHVKVGFLKPFMSAFAEDVSGYASGHARLFGTFHDIDLEGDLYADRFGLKVGFTNAWYYATDSVHIRPGIIKFDNIHLTDAVGNTATLNGFLKHDYFHRPVFEFRVSDARNFLCYDVPAKLSPDWYGRIFGNGSASVTGRPGVVNIDVNMSTAENSTFTFVLSDALEADDYTFITFRDPTKGVVTDSIIEVDPLPLAVREYRDRMRAKAAAMDEPSDYNMNIQVDITPAARIVLVMDPVGGDEIKANGSGNLRMTYSLPGNDLHMYGTYTIDRGSYNFTLQDIIVKDFTIREGSSITFTGDPYAARLDIKAIYSVNANLSDLDESFLQDKDLNRTNVPVHALLMASGDMRQPDISFDLEFPTLTSDIYRKVRSIVSTEEMMNRQIIYLLALNRFYTPEYMSTTKGNELFSVASSTISSQLSSMLGKLSENWSIAPNLRSDRGDFSDVEVDLALSSNLLNNRLRLNGNFGYRDKSLNTNQFIGDFDVEYLLNRRGTWRLKAYNRYNDQNYYLRTAQTTQGVGIMFKRDFDNMFNFLKPRNKQTKPAEHKTDTIRIEKPDSVPGLLQFR